MAGIRSAGISGLLVKIVTFFGAEYINIYVPYGANQRNMCVSACAQSVASLNNNIFFSTIALTAPVCYPL